MVAQKVYRPRIGLAIVLGLAIGLVGSLMALKVITPPPNYVANPLPRYEYEDDTPPSRSREDSARILLQQADAAVERRDFLSADRLYGHCIELADLGDCHRGLAGVLFLARDPSARAHYEKYAAATP